MKGFNAKGLKVIVEYNCCFEASIPISLNKGKLTDITKALTPPYIAKFCIANQERNLQLKTDDKSAKYTFVDVHGCRIRSRHISELVLLLCASDGDLWKSVNVIEDCSLSYSLLSSPPNDDRRLLNFLVISGDGSICVSRSIFGVLAAY